MGSAVFPLTCGSQVTRTCLNNGSFDGSLPVYTSCSQQCLHPDNNQAVNSGTQYTYFTKASGASQAECDAARVVSSCQQDSGTFAPAVATTRFPACAVQVPMCAYSVVAGTATPTGTTVGSTVTGFATQTATSPNLCGATVTRSCLSTSQWSGAVPVYTACTQQCRHPDNNQAVNAGSQYTYFTRATGATQAECDAARVVSSCQQATGLYAPAPAATRYAACLVQGQTCAYNTVAGTATPTGNLMGATVTGFATQTATSPNLCGAAVTRTCQSSGQWTGAVPVYTACTQQCRHPDNNQAVNAGSQYAYFTKATAASQAECDASRVVSSCQQNTGLYSPAPAATRYAACAVQLPMCAYNVTAGTATPTGTSQGSTVTGFAMQSATHPTLCGATVTRTCQSTSQWSGAIPVYSACVQKCSHPDSAQPVDSGSLYVFYTKSKGTTAECNAARVTSSCQASTGTFSPAVVATRFSTCQIQDVPDKVTHEMLVGTDTRYNVFKQHCTSCHSVGQALGGLNIFDPLAARNKASVILSRMKHENKNLSPMPTSGVLSDPFMIALVEKWVSLGAPSDTVVTVTNPFQCTTPTLTSLKPMRRLTREEIRNVITSFGSASLSTALTSKINTLPDDRIANKLSDYQPLVTEDQTQIYQSLAELATDTLQTNAAAYQELAGTCFAQATLTTACRDTFLDKVGLRAFRRPLTATEKSEMVAQFFGNGFTARESAGLTLYKVLLSPNFLFHLEMGTSPDPINGSLPLDQYEVASRLSFALWDGPPDDTLLTAAKNGQLATLDQRRLQFDRMIQDSRAKTKLMRFFRYWLAPKSYPASGFSTSFLAEVTDFPGTMSELNEEMDRFIEYVVWQKRGSFRDLLLDNTSFARTPAAAAIYGHTAVSSTSTTGAPMTGERAGLLLRSPFLMTEGNETHPIIRGVKIRTRILCEELGAPSGVLVAGNDLFSNEARAMHSTRYRTTELTKSETCMACHSKINPLGFALEGYDNLGRKRTQEKAYSTATGLQIGTHAIDTAVMTPLIDSSTTSLVGGRDLAEKLTEGDRAPSCFVKQVHRFYSFQNEAPEDSCQLSAAYDKLKTPGYSNAAILDVYKEMIVNANIDKRRTK